MSRHERVGGSLSARIRNLGAWVLLPTAVIVVLVLLVQDTGPAWRAWNDEGQPGVLVVDDRDCGKSCSVYGTFTSDDGTRVLDDVVLDHDGHVGDEIRTQYTGDRSKVYVPHDNEIWFMALIGVVGLGYLVAYPWLLARHRRHQDHGPN
jgi:hypothetical protein